MKYQYLFRDKEGRLITDYVFSFSELINGDAGYKSGQLKEVEGYTLVAVRRSIGEVDKLGRDIFEGDILQRARNDGTLWEKKYIIPTIEEIIQEFPTAKIRFEESELKTRLDRIFEKVIVGNIYESEDY